VRSAAEDLKITSIYSQSRIHQEVLRQGKSGVYKDRMNELIKKQLG
jgi:hypothetical protein